MKPKGDAKVEADKRIRDIRWRASTDLLALRLLIFVMLAYVFNSEN